MDCEQQLCLAHLAVCDVLYLYSKQGPMLVEETDESSEDEYDVEELENTRLHWKICCRPKLSQSTSQLWLNYSVAAQ